MDVVVTGIGLVSALGERECTWESLLAGKSGIQKWQFFEALPASPIAIMGPRPMDLVALTETIVTAALVDAGLVVPLADCGVVVGSSRGGQGRMEALLTGALTGNTVQLEEVEFGRRWLAALPNAAAIATAQLIQTQAMVFAPMAACATGLWAIAQGAALIRRGECQRVVAGAVEAPITPLTLAGFRQMGALANRGCYPFDRGREGLVLGEGGAVLVLEAAELAQQRQAPVYGRVLGVGLTADGYHVSAPDLNGVAAIAAIHQCLQRSGLAATSVDYIHAHGTGTRLNDQREAVIIADLFPQGVPLSSTKGATGHTLGASGALGAAFCLMALRAQRLPPCVGLQMPEFPLQFVTRSTEMLVNHALCLSFGFGGQNAAIAFGR